MAPMYRPRLREETIMVALLDNDVLVMGGTALDMTLRGAEAITIADVERYNLQNNVWTRVSPMNQDRKWFQAVVLHNGMVLVIGGTAVSPTLEQALSSCELFDPETNFWSPAASMSQARGGFFGAEVLASREVIVFGSGLSTCEIYNSLTDTWKAGGTIMKPCYLNNGLGANSFSQLDNGNIVARPVFYFSLAPSLLSRSLAQNP